VRDQALSADKANDQGYDKNRGVASGHRASI
jgi:hypothetical protein